MKEWRSRLKGNYAVKYSQLSTRYRLSDKLSQTLDLI
jgi:hypothetical protein